MSLDLPIIRLKENKNKSYEISGNGKKGLLIVCSTADTTNENTAKLQEILNALDHDINEDIFLLKKDSPHYLNEISIEFSKLISFGFKPAELGLPRHLKPYTRYRFESFSVVLSDSIHLIKSDVTKKKMLWSSIQAYKS